MNKLNILEEMTAEVEAEEDYDEPNGCTWIVTVDDAGDCNVVRRPNIHWSFFENGNYAEDIGITGYEKFSPGLYKIKTDFSISTDWETGIPDDHDFYITEHEALYVLEVV